MAADTDLPHWQELERKTVFNKFGRTIDRIDFKLPDGSVADFYIRGGSAVAAVVALTEDNHVILARQFRPGPRQVFNDLPGGYVDPGEEPQAAIKRELEEETGYQGDFEYLGVSYESAYSEMECHCFVAKNCRKVSQPMQTASEQIEVVLLPVADFRRQLRAGLMTDAVVGYRGLDHLGLL